MKYFWFENPDTTIGGVGITEKDTLPPDAIECTQEEYEAKLILMNQQLGLDTNPVVPYNVKSEIDAIKSRLDALESPK